MGHLNKETLKAMKTSASAMKATVKEADLDKADELMEDINEVMDQVTWVNEAMSQPLGQIMDDDELEDELAALEELEVDELLNDLQEAPKQQNNNYDQDLHMPSVPTGKIKQKEQQDEDDELAELEAM